MENEERTGSGTGLAIFALVIGIIALLFSFIPCIGAFAIYVAPISLLISIVAFFIQNSNNQPTGLAIGAILISLLASCIAFYQAYQIHSAGQALNQFSNDMQKDRESVLNNTSNQLYPHEHNGPIESTPDTTFVLDQPMILGKTDGEIKSLLNGKDYKTGQTDNGSSDIIIGIPIGSIAYIFNSSNQCYLIFFYPNTKELVDYYRQFFNVSYGGPLGQTDPPRWATSDAKVLINVFYPVDSKPYFQWSSMNNLYGSASDMTVKDIDGNVYETIQIGTQVWMKENLRTTHFQDGSAIMETEDSITWAYLYLNSPKIATYCYYNANIAYNDTFGKLYNWYCVVDDRQLCPAGWHIPTDSEWTIMTNYLGGKELSGGRMKASSLWQAPNTGADNSSGFTALPDGNRQPDGAFSDLGFECYFWSSSQNGKYGPTISRLSYRNSRCFIGNADPRYGVSVRCVKN